MPKGKVKEYDAERGYGSIVDSETGKRITVYANDINLKQGQVLAVGQDVTYETEHGRRNNRAIHVRIREMD